jgi:hypothetical protein
MFKSMKYIVFFAMLLFLVACNEVITEKGVLSIEVDQSSIIESYYIEDFDLSTIKIVVTYTDETTEVISLDLAMISEEQHDLLFLPGTHNINIDYQGVSVSILITLLDDQDMIENIYKLGVEANLIVEMTYEEWLESIKGEQGIPGENGKEIVLRTNATHIQWSYSGENSWSDLVSLDLLTGPSGEDGKSIEFDVQNGFLKWRYVDGEIWEDLFDLSILKGDHGEDGLSPFIGDNGNWYVGENDLGVSAVGKDGIDGITPHIGENGNWFIGDIDTLVLANVANVNMDRIGTDGLYFDLTIRNGIAGYEVVDYTGTDLDIIVPNEIFGQKVISIKQGALPTTINSLSISKYTEEIPSFENYTKLTSIDFNDAPVSLIPNNGFKGAISLKTVENYDHVQTIGSYAFYNTQILFSAFDFTNIASIGDYAFYTTSISNLDVDGLIFLETDNGYSVSDQTYIYLPKTVENIGYRAFPSMFSIYYEGNSEVVFNSEMFFKNVKRTDDGYWYVDHDTYVGLLNYTGDLDVIVVPNKLDSKDVTVVEKYAFIGNQQLSRVDLPSSISSIGNYSFVLMRGLYILHIPSSIVNISDSYFGMWDGYEYDTYGIHFTAPVLVFENNQVDMNFGSNTISSYNWGRYAFGNSANQIQQDDDFVYLEKLLTYEILAIKNTSGKVTIPAYFNLKPISRINQYSLIGYNGGVTMIDISSGIEYISTNAFYKSTYLRFINVPNTINAVNYQGFYYLTKAEIHIEANEKPSNWDSNWYYNVGTIIWGSEFTDNISQDGLYLYEIIGNNAKITKYLGEWSSTSPLFIPEQIDGYHVTSIASNAIKYTSSSSSLEIVIPNTVITIEPQAITYYMNLYIYSNLVSRPSGWATTFGDSYYYGTSDSYRYYYWEGTWVIVNNDPRPAS